MVNAKYCMLSILSGCVWAAIGYQLGHRWMSPFIWGGVVASPFIGLVVGQLYRGACGRSFLVRVVLSLATLYLAVTLFGLAAGIYDALRPIPNRFAPAVVLQTIYGVWWGITFTGYFLVFWPLSFVNHSLVCRFGKVVSQGPVR